MLRISSTLQTAYDSLIAEFERQIPLYKRSGFACNTAQICRNIESFVDELCKVEIAKTELKRRATLIQQLCQDGSEYFQARNRTIAPLNKNLDNYGIFRHLALALTRSDPTPNFLTAVGAVESNITTFLKMPDSELNAGLINGLKQWQSECHRIRRKSNGMEPDGCLFILAVYEPGEDDSSESSRSPRAWIENPSTGGAHLASMKRATESLMGWLNDQINLTTATTKPYPVLDELVAPPPSTNTSKKRRGRRGRSVEVQEKEKEIFDAWQRARSTGISKLEFAQDKFPGQKDPYKLLDRLIDRVRGRLSRSE